MYYLMKPFKNVLTYNVCFVCHFFCAVLLFLYCKVANIPFCSSENTTGATEKEVVSG